MFSKAEMFGDEKTANLIMRCAHPAKIKSLGRSVKGFQQQQWEKAIPSIADACNLAKFSQHPRLKELLLQTGQATIAEASATDCIWGIEEA